MKNKENIQDELKELSPFLFEQKNKPEGFGVPKDYFRSLPDDVLDKVRTKPAAIPPTIESNWLDDIVVMLQSLFQPRYAYALATVALLLVAGVYFSTESDTPQPLSAMLDQVPDTALDDYITENIDDFEVALLEEHIDEKIGTNPPVLNLDEDDQLLEELLDDLSIEDLEDLL